MSVHAHLLVESGIHIIEVLNLEELARDETSEFVLVAAPMNISGATGAPSGPSRFQFDDRARVNSVCRLTAIPVPGSWLYCGTLSTMEAIQVVREANSGSAIIANIRLRKPGNDRSSSPSFPDIRISIARRIA